MINSKNVVRDWHQIGRVCTLICCLLGVSHVPAHAQSQASSFRLSPSEAVSASVSRQSEIERRFVETRDWTFYHTVSEIPEDVRSVLFRVAGQPVASPGEPFNTGDIFQYPSNSQHLYTAVSSTFGVVTWYSGGVGGISFHAVVYDREMHDAVRYDFLGQPPAIMPIASLRSAIQNKGSVVLAQYLAPN